MAFLRESARNVRMLVMLNGLWLCGVSLFTLAVAAEPYSLAAVLSVAGLLFGCFYAYLAARFDHLLIARPSLIVNGLLAMLALNALWALLALVGKSFENAVQSILGALLSWYLVVNVRRLAGEARAK